MPNKLKIKVGEHLDELFDDVINISREIRKIGLPTKEEEAVLKNIQKIGENILVAHKRIHKGIK